MKCPVCDIEMKEKNFGGVHIDVCDGGCKGLWFDWHELEELDMDYEGFGDALTDALESTRVSDADRGHIDCPKCGMPMVIHKYKDKEVTVDECYLCRGFFLDAGELKAIRETFLGERDEHLFVEQIAEHVPDDHEHADDHEKRKELLDNRQGFKETLKLIFSHHKEK